MNLKIVDFVNDYLIVRDMNAKMIEIYFAKINPYPTVNFEKSSADIMSFDTVLATIVEKVTAEVTINLEEMNNGQLAVKMTFENMDEFNGFKKTLEAIG